MATFTSAGMALIAWRSILPGEAVLAEDQAFVVGVSRVVDDELATLVHFPGRLHELADPFHRVLEALKVGAHDEDQVRLPHAAELLDDGGEPAGIAFRILQPGQLLTAVVGAGNERKAPQGHRRLGCRRQHQGREEQQEEQSLRIYFH